MHQLRRQSETQYRLRKGRHSDEDQPRRQDRHHHLRRRQDRCRTPSSRLQEVRLQG